MVLFITFGVYYPIDTQEVDNTVEFMSEFYDIKNISRWNIYTNF